VDHVCLKEKLHDCAIDFGCARAATFFVMANRASASTVIVVVVVVVVVVQVSFIHGALQMDTCGQNTTLVYHKPHDIKINSNRC